MTIKKSWIPWYRRQDYKGDLSEKEKRILDSFHSEAKHPAAPYESLPDEVQEYINSLEFELFQNNKDEAIITALFATAITVIILCITYKGNLFYEAPIYGICLAALISIWVKYYKKLKNIDERNLPIRDDAPSQSDEGIQMQYELNYIVRLKNQK